MRRPLNIVWLCMDQHPVANRGPASESLPLQARMARQGVRFRNAFTVLPICSPARASMLTGLYPHAHGLTENDGRFGGRAGLDVSDWLVHQPFSKVGYRTAWFGKWHLDNCSAASAYGFEGSSLLGYGYPYGSEAYADYLKARGLKPPIATVELPGESGASPGTRCALAELPDWPDYEAGTMLLDGSAEAHEAFFVAHQACEWLEQVGDDPFFLRVDPWGPHPPYMVAAPFKDSFADAGDLRSANFGSDLSHRPAHHRDYRDSWSVLGLDDAGWRLIAQRAVEQAALVETALCRVLDALVERSLIGHTLVIVCADHGDAVASNGGVANKGGLLVEETVRIPLLMSGPGLPSGVASEAMVTNLDVAPTILAMAGLDHANDLHGSDLQPLFGPRDAQWREGALLQHYGLHAPLMQRALHLGRWKLVVQEDGFCELYDLESDPAELVNLAQTPERKRKLDEMVEALFVEMARVGDDGEGQRRLIRCINA